MEHILIFSLITLLLFSIFQSANTTFDDVVSPDLNLLKYYEESANFLISKRLSGTKFCESFLLPTHHTLRKSLHATLYLSATSDTYLDDADRLDSCCRTLHKCDAYKNIELNAANDRNIQHCECVHSFRMCLTKLNTSLSRDLAFIHSINATKCYAKDHPIIQCVKIEAYVGSAKQYLRLVSSALNDKFFNRCTKYELDERQPQKLQLYDLAFIDPGMSTIAIHGDSTESTPSLIQNIAEISNLTDNDLDEKIRSLKDILKNGLSLDKIEEFVKKALEVGCETLHDLEFLKRDAKKLGNETKEINNLGLKALRTLCEGKKKESTTEEFWPFGIYVGDINISISDSFNFQL